jgi:hypothetical protein
MPPDAIFSLPIFHSSYAFLKSLAAALSHCPKPSRYTIGVRVHNLALDVFLTLLRANALYGYKRLTTLKEASISLDLLKVLIRLAKDTQAISEKEYLLLQGQLREIGKMLGSWIKSLQTKNPV